jgi:26S proteasome non-ATPase regulatory subunit 9
VNSVAPGSPAADAGLGAGDTIYSFSGITADSPGGFQAVGGVVARSEGQALTLLVLRSGERRLLRLTPRSGWGGRGMLGCHILPL